MLNRKPLAPNNRNSSLLQFLSTLESEAISVKYPKTKNDSPSIKVYPEAGRQNSEGFGGGRIVGK